MAQSQSIFTPLNFVNTFVDQVQDAKNKIVDTPFNCIVVFLIFKMGRRFSGTGPAKMFKQHSHQ